MARLWSAELVNKLGSNDKNEYFTHEDEYLLKVLGISAGAMMGQRQYIRKYAEYTEKSGSLTGNDTIFRFYLDIDVLVKMIMQSDKDLLSADRCTLFLNDNEQKL
ncbi:hypothetical protein BASA61_009692 [Batrachochytrium salamandrivorans]|nr:hypothetical protein BASA61_009692 [Batrachochytrium salamandrivorans]